MSLFHHLSVTVSQAFAPHPGPQSTGPESGSPKNDVERCPNTQWSKDGNFFHWVTGSCMKIPVLTFEGIEAVKHEHQLG